MGHRHCYLSEASGLYDFVKSEFWGLKFHEIVRLCVQIDFLMKIMGLVLRITHACVMCLEV